MVYDFRRPTTLAREHARILELAFETFARQWGTQLTAKVRVMSQVALERVAMQTYDEYVASLPATTAMVVCEVEGITAKTVVQFPASAALNWVSHMLGSPGPTDVPDRKFTRIEQTLLRGLMDEALEDLRYSMGALLEAPMQVEAMHYSAQAAQAAAKSDLVIVAAFAIRVGERTVTASLALPADAVMPQLGDLSAAVAPQDAADMVRAHVVSIPIDVSLALAPTIITPRAVLNLAVGDVLALAHPTHRPFDLAVEGRRLGQAAAGTRGGRLAAVVVSTEENPA